MSMETVARKSLIYRTGIGGEGTYAATHVIGCSHGCRFPCYAFLMMQRFGKVATYEEWCQPKLVGNAVQLAQHELPRLRGTARSISLSFATDAFMYHQPEVSELTLHLMRLINSYDIPVHILTKGVIPSEALELSSANQFGITLVSVDEAFRQRFEPGAAPYAERVASLRRAHERGFTCFVNMEPYPTPNIWKQDIQHILDAVDFADEIRLGQLNYNEAVREYPDWRGFYQRTGLAAAAWCDAHDIDYDGPGAKRRQPGRHHTVDPESLFRAEL
ncbi:MAG TPA: radical SAM protein [Candidatus Cryosericum sp.]|nr:radical SAM protein [Candidatus Cryosericum sp.]HPS69947.1 radical SAM protein [Candidatus Cryosericum sp.]